MQAEKKPQQVRSFSKPEVKRLEKEIRVRVGTIEWDFKRQKHGQARLLQQAQTSPTTIFNHTEAHLFGEEQRK